MHAVGRRAVDAKAAVIVPLHAQGIHDRQRVAGAAAVAIRRHNRNFVARPQLIAQAAQARRLATVVVRKQDFHEGKTTKFREFTGYDSAHHGIEPSSRRERRSRSEEPTYELQSLMRIS